MCLVVMATETTVANGIEIQVTEHDRPEGVAEARSLAGHLPRGGDFGEGSVRRIEAPIDKGEPFEAILWLDGDGLARFDVPDGWRVTSVCGFDTPGTAIRLRRE